MTSKLEDYIAEGRSLDAEEREIAALALQRVDEAEQAEVDAAWDETIDRRLEDLMSGEVEAVSGRETIAIARHGRPRGAGDPRPDVPQASAVPHLTRINTACSPALQKKQIEVLCAAIKRGINDGLVDVDSEYRQSQPTNGLKNGSTATARNTTVRYTIEPWNTFMACSWLPWKPCLARLVSA